MNPVICVIKEHITNRNVYFVFPSQIVASQWAQKTCTLGIARSVAADRFLAWDRFKEEIARAKDTSRRPANAVIRKLFAQSLARENSGKVFLKSVIPPDYAGNGNIFVPFIARILPSLFLWEKLVNKISYKTGTIPDSDDEDYTLIKKRYKEFLEQHNFFEPSWEETKIKESENFYAIIFPELMEDFSEYDALLLPPRFFRITAEAAIGSHKTGLQFYKSAREEIRSAAMELRRLHEENGIPYEEMAVSVPELEDIEPCLIKEFSLRHIPIVRRAGKKLGKTGAGRLFALVRECAVSGFSFSSVKALLLNDRLPWKDREKNKELINFGRTYNCVSGYKQNGKDIDIWEEAFDGAKYDGVNELKQYYKKLKEQINKLNKSLSFSDLRKNYFSFRGTDGNSNFLDMEKITEEDNALLSRCVIELSALIEIEELPNSSDLVPESPIVFFVSHLEEVEYVKDKQKPGVNIYKWRVASATPFACHFVLNASQSASSVLYQPLGFLRPDKRKALGLEDSDASAAFFALCDTGEEDGFATITRISASEQTFSGWAIPHSFFARGKISKPPSCPEDAYGIERHFWRRLSSPSNSLSNSKETNNTDNNQTLERNPVFPAQLNSFLRWKNSLADKENYFSFFNSKVPADAHKIQKLFSQALAGKDECLTVSPTRDLNKYYRCPLFWLYERVFNLSKFSLEAQLLDNTALGLLYHKILESLFAKIKNENSVFNSANIETYKRWAFEITSETIKKEPAFKGPLAVPLVLPQSYGMAKKIAALLELEVKHFNGYTIAQLEYPASLRKGHIHIKGVIDRISVSPEGEPIIIDYKSSYTDKQTDIEDLDEQHLSDFQIPLYIKLYEESIAAKSKEQNIKVQSAYYYNIRDGKIQPQMGNKLTSRSNIPMRDDYEPFLAAVQNQIDEFFENVSELKFMPCSVDTSQCFECDYKTICRSAYFLNRSQFLEGEN